MRFSTTRQRLNHMLRVVPDHLAEELSRAQGRSGPTARVEILGVPFVVLERTRQAMVNRCYTSRSTLRRGLSKSMTAAIADLASAVNGERRHPALRGIGAVGHQASVHHVWTDPASPSGLCDPWPREGWKFVVLKPNWHVDDNAPSVKFTLWNAEIGHAPEPDRLADEAFHFGLLR